jgi:hypothetical protein
MKFGLFIFLVPVAISGVTLAGCSRSGFESQVSGRITLEGKPMGSGTVVFVPEGENRNAPMGTIEPNGDYFLKTNRDTGLMPGKYTVSMSVYDTPPHQPGERMQTTGKQLVPTKYTDAHTSGLEYEVKPGSNTINIDLTSK